ncbi:DCC family protein [Platanthera zijinensis]|uniref:DCC family protein n=1 Tax=Platanthera zijinensis TaxID=2320716 RepID=A0AAP0ASL1_9ASPA
MLGGLGLESACFCDLAYRQFVLRDGAFPRTGCKSGSWLLAWLWKLCWRAVLELADWGLVRRARVGLLLPHRSYIKSEAVIKIMEYLELPFPQLGSLMKLAPLFLRDFVYDNVANNRYVIFGRSETELTRQFADQFIANRRIVRDPLHLSGIRQNEGESLKVFFRRFTFEARQISGVDPELLRGVFLGGLHPSGFYSALMRETVPSYPDLVHRVEAQIAADEAIEAHRLQFEGRQKRKKEEKPTLTRQEERRRSERRHDSRQRDLPRNGGQHPLQEYTPLNTTRTNVMYAIQNDPAFQRPRAPRPNPKADQTRYCEFQRTTGHNTEECVGLKDEIERLVRQGLLGRFLQGQAQIPAQGNGGGRQMVGNIETIVGPPAMDI